MDFSGDALDQLPTDSNEPLAHMDLGLAQKVFKKSRRTPAPAAPAGPAGIQPIANSLASHSSQHSFAPPVSLEIVQQQHADGTTYAAAGLMHNVKLTVIATALFLLLSHPKVDELIRKFKLDAFTSYAVKGTLFAILFFLLKAKFC
jgi:hypothetical protein